MWTLQEIADKKDSEGGWYEFFMWGAPPPEEVPEEIRERWTYLTEAFNNFEEAIELVGKALPEPEVW